MVDGNNHQIDRIQAEAKTRGVEVAIVVDLIHVLEYIWGAAWCFYAEGDPAAQAWVHDRALAVLDGNARSVAAGIRRRATETRLSKQKRTKADACAKYLTNKADYLDYPTALAAGWPVASAEAVLKLRALRANDNFDEYWKFHLNNERHRVHQTRYAAGPIPMAA